MDIDLDAAGENRSKIKGSRKATTSSRSRAQVASTNTAVTNFPRRAAKDKQFLILIGRTQIFAYAASI
jgi:hypothetical protein